MTGMVGSSGVDDGWREYLKRPKLTCMFSGAIGGAYERALPRGYGQGPANIA
jgi:hypothetical protein